MKKYVIKGNLRKRGESLPFTKEMTAVKKEDAVQQLYMDMGSRHKAKRFEIEILEIQETIVGTGEASLASERSEIGEEA